MAAEQRKKTVYYKRGEFFEESLVLSDVLRAAVQQRRSAKSRMMTVRDGSVRLLNHFQKLGRGAICGTILEFTEGDAQPIVELSDEAELSVSLMSTPSAREQFVQGTAFFVIYRNHLVLAQSKSLRAAHVEQYLDWLLREATQIAPDGARFLLNDSPSREQRRRFEGVKSISITPSYEVTDGAEEMDEEQSPRWFGIRRDLVETVVRVIESSMKRPFDKSLDVPNALAQKTLRARIELSIEGKVPEHGVLLLDHLAGALRNADDIDYVLKVPGRGDVRSGELRLKGEVSVPFVDGMPDVGRLFVEMHGWLEELLQRGDITEL